MHNEGGREVTVECTQRSLTVVVFIVANCFPPTALITRARTGQVHTRTCIGDLQRVHSTPTPVGGVRVMNGIYQIMTHCGMIAVLGVYLLRPDYSD
jgi:hypothetical protein